MSGAIAPRDPAHATPLLGAQFMSSRPVSGNLTFAIQAQCAEWELIVYLVRNAEVLNVFIASCDRLNFEHSSAACLLCLLC